MGRYTKNVLPKTASYSWRLPQGTNALGPNDPQDGQLRFNKTTNSLEYFQNAQWNTIAIQGTVSIDVDNYIGNNVTTDFTMSVPHSAGNEMEVLVFVGGVYQNPSSAYTVNTTIITFTSPPPSGQAIVILHNFNSTVTG